MTAAVTTFGRYELLTLQSEGALSEVWLARQGGSSGFEKLVLLKRLHKKLGSDGEYVDRFLDEARINALLHHQNLLAVLELGEVDGRYFIASEYVEGLSLATLVERAAQRLSALPIAIAANLVLQAARGIHHAHEARASDGTPLSIVHRELSPANLSVGFDGVLKVADFGVAQAEGRRARTETGDVRGTPTYMSPEQVTGGTVDRRSDVFGLGILLWELLTSRRLFARDTPAATYDAIVTSTIDAPSVLRPGLPAAFDRVTMKALARSTADRYATAAELVTDLAAAMRSEGLVAEVADVRAFLGEHFAAELREQEALLVAMHTERELVAPVFGEPGVPGPDDPATIYPFKEGDTDREHEMAAQDPEPITMLRVPAQPPAQSHTRWIMLAVVAVVLALVAGVLAGRFSR